MLNKLNATLFTPCLSRTHVHKVTKQKKHNAYLTSCYHCTLLIWKEKAQLKKANNVYIMMHF